MRSMGGHDGNLNAPLPSVRMGTLSLRHSFGRSATLQHFCNKNFRNCHRMLRESLIQISLGSERRAHPGAGVEQQRHIVGGVIDSCGVVEPNSRMKVTGVSCADYHQRRRRLRANAPWMCCYLMGIEGDGFKTRVQSLRLPRLSSIPRKRGTEDGFRFLDAPTVGGIDFICSNANAAYELG